MDAATVRDKCVELKEFFGTNVDGKFLVENSTKALMGGRRQNVPLMITRTTDEFPSAIDAADMDAFRAKIREAMGKYADEFLSLCGDDIKTALADSKVSGLEISARALAARETELKLKSPIYYGVFDGEIPGWDHPGTFHSVDLWFYFETLAKCWRPFTGKHLDLARNMCNYWANFTKSGDPNGEDVDGAQMPEWTPMSADMKNAMWFTDHPEPREDAPDGKMKPQISAFTDKIISE